MVPTKRAGLLATCRADLASLAELKRAPRSVRTTLDMLGLPGAWAVLLFRCSARLHRSHLRVFSRMLYFANVVAFGADLAPDAEVGPGLAIPHPVGVTFSSVTVGARLRIVGPVVLGGGGFADPSLDGFPTIGDECWLFGGTRVLGPVTIGDRTVVGADSQVRCDLPSGVIAVGRPAKVLRPRDDLGQTEPGPARGEQVA